MSTGQMTSGELMFNENPAIRRKDWLPDDTPFEELNHLHVQHVLLLEALETIAWERYALDASYEAEDKGETKSRTSRSERADALDEIEHRREQLVSEIFQFVLDAVTTVQEHEEEWCSVLAAEEQEAVDRVEQARLALARAEVEAESQPKLRTWIERTAVDRQGWHLHWGWFEKPPTTDLLTIANQGMAANSPPSEALRREREPQDPNTVVPDYSDETHDYDGPEYQKELERTIGSLPRGRRPGSATPGGL